MGGERKKPQKNCDLAQAKAAVMVVLEKTRERRQEGGELQVTRT